MGHWCPLTFYSNQFTCGQELEGMAVKSRLQDSIHGIGRVKEGGRGSTGVQASPSPNSTPTQRPGDGWWSPLSVPPPNEAHCCGRTPRGPGVGGEGAAAVGLGFPGPPQPGSGPRARLSSAWRPGLLRRSPSPSLGLGPAAAGPELWGGCEPSPLPRPAPQQPPAPRPPQPVQPPGPPSQPSAAPPHLSSPQAPSSATGTSANDCSPGPGPTCTAQPSLEVGGGELSTLLRLSLAHRGQGRSFIGCA
ncbi:proline-rich proteoglycan 2-like [Trichosurus vulpecula]|uniref:proline-rich proteoglycan 2-like n=1 Tax=Trichosurus vulpecula TaxID=9337 RepID=UPI00186ACAE0|nr:proline-rich proteoglycan 2-like [Trichosurus vulpecula]